MVILLRASRLRRDEVTGNERGGFWMVDWRQMKKSIKVEGKAERALDAGPSTLDCCWSVELAQFFFLWGFGVGAWGSCFMACSKSASKGRGCVSRNIRYRWYSCSAFVFACSAEIFPAWSSNSCSENFRNSSSLVIQSRMVITLRCRARSSANSM